MVNKAISLDENPSIEEFYGFRAMVRDEGSIFFVYVQQADRIHVQANYRREELMGEDDQTTQHSQAVSNYEPTNIENVTYMTAQTPEISRNPSLSSLENVFSSNQPQHFDKAPNFVDGDELEDANQGASQGGEPSVKKKRTIIPKLCGTGSHYLNQHDQKNKTKVSVLTKKKDKGSINMKKKSL
ncbi:uncharacterized protein LOC107006357 [Solanum pennellii]|uniref:Uncharacterized protein LOC107006357 n=1 Tax=Solanum pennellii TaxID=28526 RepID=A0ABM1FQX0_SOLPN|nr:uncharacterized protein LOC107006357 [Solanum pennellii]